MERVVLLKFSGEKKHLYVVTEKASYMPADYAYACDRWGRHVNSGTLRPRLRSASSMVVSGG